MIGLAMVVQALAGGFAPQVDLAGRRASVHDTHEMPAFNTFGQPIANYQAIQWMLADMATELDAARMLTLRAASARTTLMATKPAAPVTRTRAMPTSPDDASTGRSATSSGHSATS